MNAIKRLHELLASISEKEVPESIQVEDNGNGYTVFKSPYAFSVIKVEGEEIMTRNGWQYVDGTTYKFTDFSLIYDGGYEPIKVTEAYELIKEALQ